MPLRQFLARKFKYLIDFNQAQKIERLKGFHFTSSPLIVIIKIEQWTDCSCWENSIYKRKDPTNGLVFFKTEKITVAFYCTFISYRQISKKTERSGICTQTIWILTPKIKIWWRSALFENHSKCRIWTSKLDIFHWCLVTLLDCKHQVCKKLLAFVMNFCPLKMKT